jgi:hypothetical protein
MTDGSSIPRDLAPNWRVSLWRALGRDARRFLAVVGLGALALLSPVSLRSWSVAGEAFVPRPLTAPARAASMPAQADLDGDGSPETLDLISGGLTIVSNGRPGWQSPSGWFVRQAAFTDLNRDGKTEVTLLVWREFSPWPTDRLLPHGGRIDSFHDDSGRSCHLILIGSDGAGGFREIWAGSALADPITSYAAMDLDQDGLQELLTLENRYTDDPGQSSGRSLKVWEWNGFGFTASDRLDLGISRFQVVRSDTSSQIIAQVIW